LAVPFQVAGLWIGLSGISVAAAPFPLSEDFETGLSAWTPGGAWGLTTLDHRSPSHAATDSPTGFYADNQDQALTLASSVNLTGAVRPALRFWHRHDLEQDYDFAQVEISTNGGATWSLLPGARYTGARMAWARDQLDLSPYIGQADVRLRFRITTDFSVVRDGWTVDDVRVDTAPLPVTLATPTGVLPHAVPLSWSAYAGGDFQAYHVLRGTVAGQDWRTLPVVAEISAAGTTSYTDVTAAPKTTYYYRVLTLNTAGMHSLSAEQAVTTPPGMNWPFLDNAEGGPTTWVADPPWAISEEIAGSPSHAWVDSPGGDYAPNLGSQSLTLAAPISLVGATHPVWCFQHRFVFASGDQGYAEISTNNGVNWTGLATFSGTSTDWRRERLDLSAYAGQSAVLVRFRLTSDAGGVADGWALDDISISEAPATIAAPVLDQVASHTLRVSWTPLAEAGFRRYEIRRSTSPGVTLYAPLAGVVTDRTTGEFIDSDLILDTVYYYRVFAVNPQEGYSLPSAQEASARTLNHPLPFTEDFEGSLQGWQFTGSWGATTEQPGGGARSLTDSPGTLYTHNQESYALVPVNPSGLAWPVLRFRQRYALASGDWLAVEVSADNGGWSRLLAIYEGAEPAWTWQEIGLVPWRNAGNLRIRFLLRADGDPASVADGWHIDEISITDRARVAQPLPWLEDFTSGLTGWLSSGWTTTTNAYSGAQAAEGPQAGRIGPDSYTALEYGQVFNLAATARPQLTYYVRPNVHYGAYFRAQICTDGTNWGDLPSGIGNFTGPWQRTQIDLTSYRVDGLRLRFVYSGDWRAPGGEALVDFVSVQEPPASTVLHIPVPHLKSVDLSWDPSAIGTAFKRYELFRATHATVTPADTRIAQFTDVGSTSFTDTGLSIGTTYYYGLFVVDQNEVYSLVSERSATTVPLAIGFTDAMEDLAYWDATGQWGADTQDPFGGAACLSDSPGSDYVPSQESHILTAVNLVGAQWPVLRFRDRYALASGDWIAVEVSANGGGWQRLYGVYEGIRTAWHTQDYSLLPWRGVANLRIRFVLHSDAGNAADGWAIDDVSVTERPQVAQPLPWLESFAATNPDWLSGGWTVSTNAYHGGAAAEGPSADRVAPDSYTVLEYGKVFNLAGTTRPQLTYFVRPNVQYGATFRAQYCTDGTNWGDLPNGIGNFTGPWQRTQIDLTPYRVDGARFRFAYSGDWRAPGGEAWVDFVSVQEPPASTILHNPVPALKSVSLSWEPSGIGAAFRRYELYRATHATVTPADTRVGLFTDVGQTTLVDTGLAIGTTYYYGLFVVDQNEVYSLVSERSTTTVPRLVGFDDPMEDLASWDVTGQWGVDNLNPYAGAACLSDSPGGDYAPSQESHLLTAVNLTGSTWPVLRFRDRQALARGDWIAVEVSANGGGWQRVYGIYEGIRTAWRTQEISLLPWRAVSNLRIRFVLRTDGSNAADGWAIDDVAVYDRPRVAQPLPWTESFESGLTDWMSAGWGASPEAYHGAASVEGPEAERTGPDSYTALEFGKVFDLATHTRPQLVYYVKPAVAYGASFRAQICTDGTNWGDLPSGIGNFTGPWQRTQIDLTPYRVDGLRLRFVYSSDWRAAGGDVRLDRVSVQEPPAAVTLSPPDQSTVSTLRLQWSASEDPDFLEYRVYRSTAPNVSEGSTLAATFSSAGQAMFTDSGLTARTLYYYRVYTYDTRGVGWPSNEASARTLGLPLGTLDTFDTLGPAWTFTGPWVLAPGAGRDGGSALTDSVSAYDPSLTAIAQTAVDLSQATHPVLRFWDRLLLNGGDWVAVEIAREGGGWSRMYSAYETVRPEWLEQGIDLSPWKGADSVYIRFILRTDGATAGDGWYLDDFRVEDIGAVAHYPLIDRFETGLDAWLHSGWQITGESAQEGGQSVEDTPGFRMGPDSSLCLTLAGTLDLSQSVAPELTYYYKAAMEHGSWFRVQISTDGGLGWSDLPGGNLDNGVNVGWTRARIPLTAWRVPNVRIRFLSAGDWRAPTPTVRLDRIAVGDPAPGAPTRAAPGHLALVETRRPTLVVHNAVDYQDDPLTYRFEVYADAALSQLVASVPGVAQGLSQSAWTVDVDLPDNAQFWWRCRADDGAELGPWMATASFFVTEVNNPPLPVVPAGPVVGGILPSLADHLAWYPTEDPDEGDSVVLYHVQIAEDSGFATLVVDANALAVAGLAPGEDWAVTLPLADLPGAGALVNGRSYAWRIRARDTRFGWSEWNDGLWWFTIGLPPPALDGLSAAPGGAIQVRWARRPGAAVIYWSPTLVNPDWQPLSGTLIGTDGTVTPPPGTTSGFFRIEVAD
jgi:fibronectin type 3 domain-containing protein